MKNLNQIESIYFVGIGGIGMSALARYFKSQGKKVYGYDRSRTPLTELLENEQIEIYYQDELNSVLKEVDLVVYTPAIPKENIILKYYFENHPVVKKRSDVLEMITDSKYTIAVAGTHGKTTISTMIAHILRDSGLGCSAFLGGIAANYQSNFWSDSNDIVVVEADEYDRSFLKLHPTIAVISNTDPDHLDIYKTEEAFKAGFVEFTSKIKDGGVLFLKHNALKVSANLTTFQYQLEESSDDKIIYPYHINIAFGKYTFKINHPDLHGEIFQLSMGGLHNIENAVVAISVALHLKIEIPKIQKAIENFKGVVRRFEYKINKPNQILIDDYAHHPKELKALIDGVNNVFPNQDWTLVFQPHLFTRTRDFQIQFAEVLSLAKNIILLPIYPAREKAIAGVSSSSILEKISIKNKWLMEKEFFYNWIKENRPTLLVMAGAGDIDMVIEETKKILNN